jgi:hypothetical protein
MFLVQFPSASKICEVSIYDCVPLRGANILINVSKWNDELLAAGKLSTVWVKARGIPRSLKNYQGICEVGSTIGLVIEVDMELVKKTKQVEIKFGVVDHTKIPHVARVTTKELIFYDVRFEKEEVVEEVWVSDEHLMQDLDDLYDIISDSRNHDKKNSDSRNHDKSNNEDNVEKIVFASERTTLALEHREAILKAQDALDAQLMERNTARNLLSSLQNNGIAATEAPRQTLPASGDISSKNTDENYEGEDKVQLSDFDEEEETNNILSQDSFCEKVEAFTGK